ncbi:hypothetical protein DB35_25020 [Streptomyces abyssalis]|uniref:Uncharacterized protein n=1 Tax=Streptomyces abyssalis TaxID=933944 RepID=A0A1E7JN96_9ACTN|nr:hypothetical protein [Streptomyces abyssalis]OEU86864.1 hypothetical protein DB35_25020 [Streptomyces abyssalis]OEU89752.1 hypothetical protein AN215_08545 [Streptomyces abyssalis]OEV31364.1 hypothetical protein AN219_05910 [Streptomyces nanshensis]
MADEEWTCGKGLAASAELPARMGELTDRLANVLQNHMGALPVADPDGKQEHDAYGRLVREYRAIASQLAAAAEAMESYRGLPACPHDEAVMAEPAAQEVFEALVRAEDELLALLKQRSEENHAMLGEWGSQGDAPPGDAR